MAKTYGMLSVLAGALGVVLTLLSFTVGPNGTIMGIGAAQGMQYIMVYFLAAIWFALMSEMK